MSLVHFPCFFLDPKRGTGRCELNTVDVLTPESGSPVKIPAFTLEAGGSDDCS